MKNAICYAAQLPSATNLEAHMVERPWREIGFGEKIRHAFVAGDTGLRVHAFPGGYAICLRTDEKILPASVVKRHTDDEVKELEKVTGEKVTRKRRKELKEEVYDALLRSALVKDSHTWAYYDQKAGLLFVDTASKKTADALMTELVLCCESVKTQTMHVSELTKGLTARMINTIKEGQSDFGVFDIGATLMMQRKWEDAPLERVTYAESDIQSDEVLAVLSQGFKVEAIELVWRGVAFRLTSEFRFKRFDFPELEPISEDDESENWRHETAINVAAASGIVKDLLDLMDYQPPKLEEAEEDA